MTYRPDPAEFVRGPQSTADQFACERGHCIDAFAELETAICGCIVHFECELDPKKVPLSQRLTALAKVQPSPRLSKEKVVKLVQLTQSCARILTIRASMVHGVMAIGEVEGESAAMFCNAADAALELPVYLALTHEGFEETRAAVLKLTIQFNEYLPAPKERHSSQNPATVDATRSAQ